MKRDAFGNISPFDYYFSALNNLKYKNTSNISIPVIYHSACHENERGVSLFLRLKISICIMVDKFILEVIKLNTC